MYINSHNIPIQEQNLLYVYCILYNLKHILGYTYTVRLIPQTIIYNFHVLTKETEVQAGKTICPPLHSYVIAKL